MNNLCNKCPSRRKNRCGFWGLTINRAVKICGNRKSNQVELPISSEENFSNFIKKISDIDYEQGEKK